MKLLFNSLIICSIAVCSCVPAQAQFGNFVKDAEKDLNNLTGNNHGKNLSSADITAGLKDALNQGAKAATGRVTAVNGFFGDQAIKILMPPEARNMEATLREMGMGSQVDQAILSMNRGAEDAAQKALPIFLKAVSNMTIEDGLSILRGNKDAATQYLKNKTSNDLYNAFLPEIRKSLDKVNATKYWSDIFSIYDEVPFVAKVNTNLPDYVTHKALDGVFYYIAQEEAKIRANPEARLTDILKKVFGS